VSGRREIYSAGYSDQLLQALSQRSLKEDGAFFLPYLKPGMDVLDCGCGPGGMTVQLAAVVSPGTAIGIDRHEDQLQLGIERARKEQLANVGFRAADVYSLPFPDESFDAAFVHAVLYHLAQPQDALREIRRVLKKGGVIGIRDADTEGDIHHPTHATLKSVWPLVYRLLAHNGASTDFGRKHRAILRETGFKEIVATASYDHFGVPDRVAAFAGYFEYFLTDLHATIILDNGWKTPEELRRMAEALRSWGKHPDAFFARSRCEAVAWK
jgi:ubiquinone/menaquinone biosynthesis C-methylase UbiE